MALDAGAVEDIIEAGERRLGEDRRRRDRRVSGSRVNDGAPRRSRMQSAGAIGAALMLTCFFITLLFGQLVLDQLPTNGLVFTGALAIVAMFAFMIGCLEQRLIEIRLELMMLNGGTRKADRRDGDRRSSRD